MGFEVVPCFCGILISALHSLHETVMTSLRVKYLHRAETFFLGNGLGFLGEWFCELEPGTYSGGGRGAF